MQTQRARAHRARSCSNRSRQRRSASARIADCVAAYGSPLVQAGLFDSRALKQKWAGDERRDAIRRESEARANLLDADSSVRLAHDPELVMLLIQCSQG